MAADYKSVLRRIYDEVHNRGNYDVLDEVVAKDCVDRSPMPGQPAGLDGIRESLQMWRTAFPDMKVITENVVAEGDHVVGIFHVTGTHKGVLMGVQPTNRKIDMTGMDWVKFRGGKIVEWGHNEDFVGLLEQLGLIKLDTIFSAQMSHGAGGKQPQPNQARAKPR